MRKILSVFALLSFALVLMFITPTFAQGPKTSDIWICPSVSTNNPNGMWVIGGSGGYYIIKPGTTSPNWPMILNPTGNLADHADFVEDLAQIPAGAGLYNDLPEYFEGWAMVLEDGAEAFGLEEGMQEISADQMIPIASAVFW